MTCKVLHVTTTDISLDLLLGPQLRAFAEAGYEVVGVSAPGPHVEAVEALGVRHVPLRHATRSMAPGRDLAALGELRKVFRAERPAIVHTHNPKPGIYGRIAASLARVPVVVNTVHGLYATPQDGLARRAVVYGLERIASTASQAELVQNPEDVVTLRRLGVPRAKLVTLGNGIDLDRFAPGGLAPATRDGLRAELGAGPDTVLCGAVGRLVWEKGIHEVVAAATNLRATHPDVRVVVVGPTDDAKADGLTSGDLAAITAESGIHFAGYRDDVERIYHALDMYVLASHREGFPRSAMEAAACGLPIVATDIRGCRQVVEDGLTGRLVPPRDVPALTAAIAAVASDAAARTAMGAAARRKAEREFDQRRVIDTTLATYDRLLRASGLGPGPAR